MPIKSISIISSLYYMAPTHVSLQLYWPWNISIIYSWPTLKIFCNISSSIFCRITTSKYGGSIF
jgi:hypothetical protein